MKLSEQGIEEAKTAGEKVADNKLEIDVAYTSLLTRALETTQYILAGSNQQWIPVHKSWRLNERHYGGLQGLNKDDARENGEKNKFINGDVLMMCNHQQKVKNNVKNI